MDLPVPQPVLPMLAKAVAGIPAADSVPGGMAYEPKWDGFRCLVLRDGDEIDLSSRGGKALNRYFPELVEALLRLLPRTCVVDGEIVVRAGEPGTQRLDWEALGQRIHPADTRIQMLAKATPAEFIAFDLVALGTQDLTGRPFAQRRAELERALAHLRPEDPVHLTALTQDADLARRWFERFEGAGLDGVVAKPLQGTYQPGKRAMSKVKHARTAEAVVIGYRVHTSGQGVGSLLLGLYDQAGRLRSVGGIAAFTNARRLELVDELEQLVLRDDSGQIPRAQTDRSRFSGSKDVSFVPLRAERVVEFAFDQLEGDRLRHTARFLRWRPDREPSSCMLDQIDRPTAYDLGDVLLAGGGPA